MNRVRYSFLFLAFVMLVAVALAQSLVIHPASGPRGTNHAVYASGLTPNAEHVISVLYRGVVIAEFPTVTTSDGELEFALMSEPEDPLGEYTVNLYEGADLIGTGTLIITDGQPRTAPDGAKAIAYNQVISGELIAGTMRDVYVFEGTTGDIISITLRSGNFDTFLALYGPDGAQLRYNDNGIPPTDAGLFAYELPQDGRYSIHATSRANAEGSGRSDRGHYMLSLSVARSAQDGPISAGETVVGELGLLTQNTQYQYTGRAGEVITVTLRSEDFDSVIRLFDAEGSQIAQDDDSGGGLDAQITAYRLPADGVYHIIVDGFRGFTGERRLQGRYTVTLEVSGGQASPAPRATPAPVTPEPQSPPPDSGPAEAGMSIGYGDSIVGELSAAAQTGTYLFFGSAGDTISIAVDSGDFDPNVALIAPNGAVIASDDDSGPNLNALIDGFTLPQNGEYAIQVDGFRGKAGNRTLHGEYVVTLTQTGSTGTSPATPAPTIAPDTGEAATITAGETLSDEFTASRQDFAYTFTAQAGDVVTIDMNSTELDPQIRLIGPDGALIAEDDDSGGGVQARLSQIVLPADGTYTIQADAFRGIARSTVYGRFTLTLAVTRADGSAAPEAPAPTATPEANTAPLETPQTGLPTIAPKDSVTLTFTGAPDEVHTFTFSAAAGDSISFDVISGGSIDTRLDLTTADGTPVAADEDGGPGFDPELYAILLPQTGDYHLSVRPETARATGTVTLTFSTLIEAALGLDSATVVTLNDKFGTEQLRFDADAGERIRLIVTSISQVGGAPELVVSQDADIVASQIIGQNLRLTFEFVVPNTGRVDVKILRDAEAYGEIEISMERVQD